MLFAFCQCSSIKIRAMVEQKDFEAVAVGPVDRDDAHWETFIYGVMDRLSNGYLAAEGEKSVNERFRIIKPGPMATDE